MLYSNRLSFCVYKAIIFHLMYNQEGLLED
jgi:hypothetical protein